MNLPIGGHRPITPPVTDPSALQQNNPPASADTAAVQKSRMEEPIVKSSQTKEKITTGARGTFSSTPAPIEGKAENAAFKKSIEREKEKLLAKIDRGMDKQLDKLTPEQKAQNAEKAIQDLEDMAWETDDNNVKTNDQIDKRNPDDIRKSIEGDVNFD